MEQDQRKGLLCGLLAAGIRMEGLLRVAIERPEAENEVAPQIREAFELYIKIFESVWAAGQAESVCAVSESEPEITEEFIPEPQPEVEEATVSVVEIAVEPEIVVEATQAPAVEAVSEPVSAPVSTAEPEVLKLD